MRRFEDYMAEVEQEFPGESTTWMKKLAQKESVESLLAVLQSVEQVSTVDTRSRQSAKIDRRGNTPTRRSKSGPLQGQTTPDHG